MLLAGLDDFVDAAEVAYIAKAFGGATTNIEVRHFSIEMISKVIENNLMKVGDLKRDGFYPWDLSNEEIIKRIEHEWALGSWPGLGEICWIANTEEGDRRARQFSENA